ncbi:hypothetical protein Dimus_027109 [Dionaea muscipula]
MEREASIERSTLGTDRRKVWKKNVRGAAVKTQVLHVKDPSLMEQAHPETGLEKKGEDIDTMAVNEVMDVFDEEESSTALHGGIHVLPEQQQQQPPMEIVEENGVLDPKGPEIVVILARGTNLGTFDVNDESAGSYFGRGFAEKGRGERREREKEVEQLASGKAVLEREVKELKKKVMQMEEEMKKVKAEADGKVRGKEERIQQLQEKLKKEDESHGISSALLMEEKEKRREDEAELERMKKKREKVQLRTKMQAEMTTRLELKELLEEYVADAETTSVQQYIKNEEFKAVMARLNKLWYAAGFDICKLQVEDELVKAEQTRTISLDMLDQLVPKNKGRYIFPKVDLLPEELILRSKLVKRPPLEIMKN